MAIGLKQANGSNISGFTSPVVPDRGFSRARTPNVRITKFGDGYEQRKKIGINHIQESYNFSFVNRPASEIDDLLTFFATLGGVEKFMITFPNTNESPLEEDVYCVCDSWSESQPQPNIKSLTITARRVYEPI